MVKRVEKSGNWQLLVRLSVFATVCALVGGLVGVFMALGMVYVSYKKIFRDRADKHGISEKTASRLGGPLIVVGALGFCFAILAVKAGSFDWSGFSYHSHGYVLASFLVGCVGFCEDFSERLSPWLRLQLLFFIVGTYVLTTSVELPKDVFSSSFPQFLNHPLVVGSGITVCVVGFINAGNLADGANGLLSGIALSVFLIGYLESGELVLLSLLASTLVFSLFNLSTGALFLGDSGAYFLSALMALVCVDLYAQGTSTVWFYACLLSYPCVELLRVMYVRSSLGSSLLVADNNHLHNMVFEKLKKIGLPPLHANTSTGLFLAAVSSCFPLIMYFSKATPLDSYLWACFFCGYGVLHLLLANVLDQNSKESNAESA